MRAFRGRVRVIHTTRFLAAAVVVMLAVLCSMLDLRPVRASGRSESWSVARYFGRRSDGASGDRVRLPRVMYWAWERPEDFRFLDGRDDAGVAFLAGTIFLSSPARGAAADSTASVVMRPRLQPLRVSPGTPLMAVIRIETPNDSWHRAPEAVDEASAVATQLTARTIDATRSMRVDATAVSPTGPYSATQLESVARLIANVANLPGVSAIQIDYDASRSERAAYAQLLVDVRRDLPQGMPLSITALASWCIGDPWLGALPAGTIDEAVPMLFRLGPDASDVAMFLQSGGEFGPAVCRGSVGLSTDESFSQGMLSGGIETTSAKWASKRIYIFSPRSWTEIDARNTNQEIETWHNE
jgi:hypothetical protein